MAVGAANGAVAPTGSSNDVHTLTGVSSLRASDLCSADQFAMAVGAANGAGFVIVASAGNDATGRLASPTYQPDIISVAAIDQGAIPGLIDDVVAPFSSTGWVVRPTVGAPGVSVASLVVPGSLSATVMSSARVGTSYLKATGTSQSAAVVSVLRRGWLKSGRRQPQRKSKSSLSQAP